MGNFGWNKGIVVGVWLRVKNIGRRFVSDQGGNFALLFALSISAVTFCALGAVEVTSLQGGQTKSQDLADIAVLASAKYMADNLDEINTENDFNKYKSKARKLGEDIALTLAEQHDFLSVESKFEFTDTSVRLDLNVKKRSVLMSAFGYEDFDINVSSTAVLPTYEPQDIDIVMITDATGSMATEIQAVQDNMRNLPVDLAGELDNAGITVGTIRVKFIFFRDYLFDNISSVGNRFDTPPSEWDGAMFESPFYELPGEIPAMESYINQFGAYGGGDNAESAIEALVHAVDASGWGDGATTVRSVVLWTDAPTRNIHEYSPPDDNLQDDWWFNSEEWAERISPEFAALDLDGRSLHMYDNFYPKTEIPATMEDVKAKFEAFHSVNANGSNDIVTFKINVSDSCTDSTGLSVCDSWGSMDAWDGFDVNQESSSLTSNDTYWETIRDIADAAKSQISARDLAIIN